MEMSSISYHPLIRLSLSPGTKVVFTAIDDKGHQEFSSALYEDLSKDVHIDKRYVEPMLVSHSSDRSCLRTSSAATTSLLSPYTPTRVMRIQARGEPSTTTSSGPTQSSAYVLVSPRSFFMCIDYEWDR